ncbi:hypothetical protein [Segetibacter aerophilus]|uniref:DUF4234 domain-containing protein n=1 Tax=Segetibacter aerophilus TaxID=670293 RepID=A0A512BEU8_9BACT|nr:hypothetical protein [Segetibacter aerophilus]GEO10499.1 hypothetical protein SAE01_29950 [Segetibacter aerophilus]
MKKVRLIVFFLLVTFAAMLNTAQAQCSICTKTAGQLGEKRAQGLNSGIIYLMLAPFTIVGYIGFRWWKAEKQNNAEVG